MVERLRWTGGELLLATERAERAERMAALGRLATGLAHEIRNPLGSIAGCIQLLKVVPSLSEEDRRLCEIIQREAARLNDLVDGHGRPIEAAQAAARERRRGQPGARSGDALVGNRGAACPTWACATKGCEQAEVQADGAQLRQLVWNLVRNAVQASRPADVVVIATQRRRVGRRSS
ncbi:MAG: histidine kinase dimerization/phospho-acceptor domain-containing protein [Polyangiaceae bacterium]